MRRILVVATLGLAFVSAAACSDDTTTASPTSPAAATSAAAAVDTKAACASLTKAGEDFKAKAIELAPKIMAAQSDNAKAAAVAAEALQALQALNTTYGSTISSINDPELKAAAEADLKTLNTAVAAVIAAGPDLAKIESVLSTQDFEKAGEAVKAVCAKA